MNANELRIGNKVLNDNVENTIIGILQENINIVNLKTKQGNIINANINLIKPIELTEEWLIKFGFEEKDNNILLGLGSYTKSKLLFLKHSGQLRLVDSRGLFLTHDDLRYVHQLQNLYFALTGNELLLKPAE